MLIGQRPARLGQVDAVQAGLPVDVGRVDGLADEGLHATGVDGRAGAAGELAHRPGVVCDLLEAVIAADGRDADRVVMARIAVEDHLGGHM